MSDLPTSQDEHVAFLNRLSDSKGFMGREFLTWLWYLAETNTDRIILQDPWEDRKLEVDLWVEDRLVLENATSATMQESVLKGGDPSQSEEAAAALRTGKTVKEIKIGLNILGVGEFTANLNCADLAPRSLKLPEPENNQENSADIDETKTTQRMIFTDTFLSALDSLFAMYMKDRVDDDWKKNGHSKISEWIKSRQPSPTLH